MLTESRPTSWLVVTCVVVLALLGCTKRNADSDGLYTAVTDDGVVIKLKRYRPTPDADFIDGQPIVLFPGFIENYDIYTSHTPPERKIVYRKMTLPQPLAPWAEMDSYIEKDPMRYYSMAYYLWSQGYDVWLVNYRGQGRGAAKSERGSRLSNLDVLAAFDVPAAIDKVIAMTGRAPVIGGRSTGGLLCYLYLQGITIDVDTFLSDGYVPHVQSDENLIVERNTKTAGFIGFDPAGELDLITKRLLDTPLLWTFLGSRYFIDLDRIIGEVIGPLLPTAVNVGIIEVMFGTISLLNDVLSPILPDEVNLFAALDMWEVKKTNRFVEDYYARKALGGFYLPVVSQYADWGVHNTQREYWNNGHDRRLFDNAGPSVDDGFYYYKDHMYKMSVPAFSVFSESSSLVDTDTIVGILFESKTHHPLDVWYEIPESAHFDITFSEDAPTIVFPLLGDWLEQLTH